MKRILSVIALSIACFIAGAQTPEQTGGVYFAYPAPSVTRFHPAPAGYEPFYISHYGRHGSRYLGSEEDYTSLLSLFADRRNLTDEGRKVAKELAQIYKDAKGKAGQLTPLGARQHRGIALRMFKTFPGVFQGTAVVNAYSSTYDRCIKSMEAFTGELDKQNPDLVVNKSSDAANMDFIAHIDKAHVEFIRDNESAVASDGISGERFAAALFKNLDVVKDKEEFIRAMYEVASDMQDIPLDINLFRLFTPEELGALYRSLNEGVNMFYGDDIRNRGFSATSSVPLWKDIVDRAQSAIGAGETAADLRFGHDVFLMGLLSFLQIDHERGTDTFLPMGANLQMAFFRNKSGAVLVKFLLNEKEIAVPVPTEIWPYYEWEDVKAFYERRMDRLGELRQLYAINTMVGTDAASVKTSPIYGSGTEERGQTIPAVLAPNGQTFWTPQTRDTELKGVSPFVYSDTLFQGIRASHWLSGGCTQDYGSFTIGFISGDLRLSPQERATSYSHELEVSAPHYYSITLPDEHLFAEMTATSHCAYFRVTPTVDGPVHIILNHNSDEKEGTVVMDPENHLLCASNPIHRIYQGDGKSAGYSGHIILWYEGSPAASGVRDGIAYVTFDGKKGMPIEFCAATSFTGIKGAKRNLNAEIGPDGFEKTAARLADIWCERFHTIEVTTDDTDARDQFYGALYRASFLPREISDCDGTFPRFAKGDIIRRKGKHYMDFALWDTYRALHPLLTIIAPTRDGEFMQSLADMYYEGLWMPIYPMWNSFTSEMSGDHAASVIADAYIKGIRNFEIDKAYDGVRQNAFGTPAKYSDYADGKGRRAVEAYWLKGYIPLEEKIEEAFHKEGQVTRTLEYAYDDYALAQLSEALNKRYDYQVLMHRSENWRNVYDVFNGWMNGRHADGSFLPAPDIAVPQSWLIEGADIHYSWYVPHNPKGLFDAMGGKEVACARLDILFDKDYYWHGNEPCHHIPYLYALAGYPEKTRQRVKQILQTSYANTPGGLPGNEDAGQMSAWYIFSCLGFYPVCPASGEYVVGAPAFPKVTLNLENGRSFTILADDSAPERITLKHSEILEGGTIRLKTN